MKKDKFYIFFNKFEAPLAFSSKGSSSIGYWQQKRHSLFRHRLTGCLTNPRIIGTQHKCERNVGAPSRFELVVGVQVSLKWSDRRRSHWASNISPPPTKTPPHEHPPRQIIICMSAAITTIRMSTVPSAYHQWCGNIKRDISHGLWIRIFGSWTYAKRALLLFTAQELHESSTIHSTFEFWDGVKNGAHIHFVNWI